MNFFLWVMNFFPKKLWEPCIKTLCAKNQVCKSIGVTCSTYRRFTKDKEENTRKWPKKGPQRAKNQNFEKQKIAFFSHVPRSIMSKNQVPRSKTVTCSAVTDRHTKLCGKSMFQTKECVFFLMSQGALCQKIRYLGQKM